MQNLCNQQLGDELVGMILRAMEKDIKPSERDVKSMSPQARRLFQIWNQLQVSEGLLVSEIYQPSRQSPHIITGGSSINQRQHTT